MLERLAAARTSGLGNRCVRLGTAVLDRPSESSHEPRDDRFGVHKRKLLTQHGADRKLKGVPYARHPQTGSRLEHLAKPANLEQGDL